MRFAHQTPGPPDQHGGHHQKLHHQRELGKRDFHACDLLHAQPDAHGLDFRNQERRNKGTRNAAHTTYHHHYKGCANGGHVHLQTGWFARQLQGACQACEQRAQRKHGREQPGLVHTQCAHHFAVLRGGAHQRAKAGARQQQVQAQQHEWPHGDEQQVIGRELAAQQLNRTLQTRCTRAKQFFRAPQPQGGILDHQHQRKRGQQLKQLRRFVDAAQQADFRQRTEYAAHQWREQQRRPEADDGLQHFHAGKGQIRTQHEEGAMRKVDDARDAKNQRQAHGHQKQ